MKEVYLVIRTGVYMQGVVGVYEEATKAVYEAKKHKVLENTKGDGYHSYCVLPFKLNKNYYDDIMELYTFGGEEKEIIEFDSEKLVEM